ncbi:dermokine isoform X16 [Macaca mulatta]
MLRITFCSDQQAKDREGVEGSSTGSSSGNHGGSGGVNGHKPGCENPGNEARGTGGSGIQNSETSPGMFNFDTFWKNFKSKLGFINWDAISKDQRSSRIP